MFREFIPECFYRGGIQRLSFKVLHFRADVPLCAVLLDLGTFVLSRRKRRVGVFVDEGFGNKNLLAAAAFQMSRNADIELRSAEAAGEDMV